MKHLFFIPPILLLLFSIPTYSFGECIEGDCQNGQGTYIYAKGNKYVGEWKDGKKHGQGARTFPGQEYVGEFKNGLYDGQGTLTLSYGGKYYSKYVGEWKAGHPHGQGTETYRVGAKYVGEWKDGKRHGQGTFTHLNGKTESGEWKGGELVQPNNAASEINLTPEEIEQLNILMKDVYGAWVLSAEGYNVAELTPEEQVALKRGLEMRKIMPQFEAQYNYNEPSESELNNPDIKQRQQRDEKLAAPFEPNIMAQIIGDYLQYHQEFKSSTPKPTTPSSEANQRRYVGILFKASTDAFEKNGYSYSATLSKLANNGFGFKTEKEVRKYSEHTDFLLKIFLGPKRAVGEVQLYRFNIYSEADIENMMKLSYRLSVEDPTLYKNN